MFALSLYVCYAPCIKPSLVRHATYNRIRLWNMNMCTTNHNRINTCLVYTEHLAFCCDSCNQLLYIKHMTCEQLCWINFL